MMESAAGVTIAAPRPCTRPRCDQHPRGRRRARRRARQPAKIASPVMKTMRRPMRSAARPPSRRKPPYVSRVGGDHPLQVLPAKFRSSWIVGSATFDDRDVEHHDEDRGADQDERLPAARIRCDCVHRPSTLHSRTMATLPGGTVTFLFTDIEGSTRLLQELGDAYGRRRRATTGGCSAENLGDKGGTEVDTQGDAFFYSFPRARDAVAGAVAAQRALAGARVAGGQRGPRAGWACTPASRRSATRATSGSTSSARARICSAGHGGQILLSETTRALLWQRAPRGRRDRRPRAAEPEGRPARADLPARRSTATRTSRR